MKLIITRPEEDGASVAASLRQQGHEVLLAPLIKIVARSDVAIPDLPYQAVCLTSANAARHLPQSFQQRKTAFTVGAQSAAAALSAGFMHVEAKGGNMQGMAAHVIACLKPVNGPVLYVSGAETSGDLQGQLEAHGFSVVKVIAYDAVPQAMPLSAAEITAAQGVLLYSQRTAKIWVEAVMALEIFPRLFHFCLSAQVASAVPEEWRRRVAAVPTEKSLLELIDLAAK